MRGKERVKHSERGKHAQKENRIANSREIDAEKERIRHEV